MDEIIILDGIKIKLRSPDLDGDGRTGDIEYLTRHPELNKTGGIAHLQQKSELAESLDSLDCDRIDPVTKMTEIDFNANLNQIEKNGYGVLDFLVSIPFLPEDVQYLTRRFKRLSVSVGGLGRSQKVAMVTGEREHKRGIGGSLIDSVKNLFQGGGQSGQP